MHVKHYDMEFSKGIYLVSIQLAEYIYTAVLITNRMVCSDYHA